MIRNLFSKLKGFLGILISSIDFRIPSIGDTVDIHIKNSHTEAFFTGIIVAKSKDNNKYFVTCDDTDCFTDLKTYKYIYPASDKIVWGDTKNIAESGSVKLVELCHIVKVH